MSDIDRLYNLSIPEPNSGCWIWMGSFKHKEYGQFCYNGKPAFAHRASYELHKGPIPDGQVVMHSCDNQSCVNPDHLLVGTCKDNSQDMKRKGRNRNVPKARGEQNGYSKLTEAAVAEIRSSPLSGRALATLLGVSKTAVIRARNKQTWRHVGA